MVNKSEFDLSFPIPGEPQTPRAKRLQHEKAANRNQLAVADIMRQKPTTNRAPTVGESQQSPGGKRGRHKSADEQGGQYKLREPKPDKPLNFD